MKASNDGSPKTGQHFADAPGVSTNPTEQAGADLAADDPANPSNNPTTEEEAQAANEADALELGGEPESETPTG